LQVHAAIHLFPVLPSDIHNGGLCTNRQTFLESLVIMPSKTNSLT
jgi:hypothetical protein